MKAAKKKTELISGNAKAESVVETGLAKLKRMQATVTPIKSDADYALRGVTLREVKALLDQAEEERTSIVKPINDGVKRLNEFFKKLTKPAQEFYDENKAEMLAYQQKKMALEVAKVEAEAKKLEKKSPEAAADLREAAQHRAAVPQVQGIETRKMWSFEVVDESQIPREFLMVDEQKLRKYAQAMKDSAKVEGVKFFEKAIMAASAS